VDRLHRYLHQLLWPARPPVSPAKRAALTVARYAYALLRDLATGELSLRAMSLVYTTMLAIVPLLAFSFSVAKGLGLHRELEPLLRRFLEPIGERADEVSSSVLGFVENVNGSALASMSIALLLLTALQLAQKVEGSFNFVWHVDRPRSLLRRFSEYLSVIFVGPLVMIVAAGLIATLSSATLVERLRQIDPIGAWFGAIGELMPYALLVAAFTFLYMVVPNARVRFLPALASGLFAGVLWAASANLFAIIFVASTTRLEAIYSGFAIVFVLMLWLHLSWLVLLVGSQLGFYLQNPFHLRLGQRTEPVSNELREHLALGAMLLVAEDFAAPRHGWTRESLAAELRLPRSALEPILAALTGAGLLTESAEHRLMPARDPHRIALADIVYAVRRGTAAMPIAEPGDWSDAVAAVAREIDTALAGVLGERNLGELIDAEAQHPEQPAAD
jgi:membrane protein